MTGWGITVIDEIITVFSGLKRKPSDGTVAYIASSDSNSYALTVEGGQGLYAPSLLLFDGDGGLSQVAPVDIQIDTTLGVIYQIEVTWNTTVPGPSGDLNPTAKILTFNTGDLTNLPISEPISSDLSFTSYVIDGITGQDNVTVGTLYARYDQRGIINGPVAFVIDTSNANAAFSNQSIRRIWRKIS